MVVFIMLQAERPADSRQFKATSEVGLLSDQCSGACPNPSHSPDKPNTVWALAICQEEITKRFLRV
jgi:hypothetical protein